MTPVLEITLLRLTSPSTQNSAIISTLRNVRTLLAQKVNPTYSHFYQGIDDPLLLLIVGVWPSLGMHRAFLANDKLREEVLGSQEGLFGFEWGIHITLSGRDPKAVMAEIGSCSGLEVGRWTVNSKSVDKFPGMLEKQDRDRKAVAKTEVGGWRCDVDEVKEGGGREFVRVRGWEEIKGVGGELRGIDGVEEIGMLEGEKGACERVEVRVARSMEL